MKDATDRCECCTGIRASTPAAIVNRPGLPEISYRMGRHSTFLETMLARLSQQSVGDDPADPNAERPLRTLSTRSADEPCIALLDAWATVADVLTFYQERIANEGYLGTATQRRSVAELARLVGYRLRPGVAAGTYVAYTLDTTAEVTTPAGSKVQSVPGPGELPQTFETSDDLLARGEWNTLAPRQTRALDPAALTAFTADGSAAGDPQPVYLKGITTGLAAGDPLLVDFGARQELFRVVGVDADSVADRTRVALRPWLATSAPSPGQPLSGLAGPPAVVIEDPLVLLDFVARATDLEAAGVQPQGRIAGRVLPVLQELRTRLVQGLAGDELHEFLEDTVLLTLRTQLAIASRGRRGPVVRWLEWMVRELGQLVEWENAARAARAAASTAAGPTASTAPGAAPGSAPPSGTTIGDVLPALAKPPSVPPANRLRLQRGVAETFAPRSDAVAGLLVAIRPELDSTLYSAWRNVPNTPPATLRLYALRTRASAFGHNAPPQQVLDTDTGVIGSREWTLDRPADEQTIEEFAVTTVLPVVRRAGLVFLDDAAGATVQITIALGPATITTSRTVAELLAGPASVDVADAGDTVLVTLQNPGVSPPTPATVTVTFARRAMRFETRLEATPSSAGDVAARLTWSSDGSDPTEVTYTADPVPTGGRDTLAVEVNVAGTVRRPGGRIATEQPDVIALDATYPGITPDGFIVLERPGSVGSPPDGELIISRVVGVREASRADYGITAKVTSVQLDQPWLAPGTGGDGFAVIRGTAVYAQSEALEVVEAPIDPVAEPVSGGEILLDRLYDGLEPGRWLIVSGERTDVSPSAAGSGASVTGVRAAEVTMIGSVRQEYDPREPAAVTRSTLVLATPLAFRYRRDTVVIYGNVVPATHGESRGEALGSGDATKAHQAFALSQRPLTHVAASTPTGTESTLEVFVDGVRWQETDSPVGLATIDRCYVTKTDDNDVTTVVFGNGVEGARLPTGQENVTAVYRFGLGAGGNLHAGQLSLLGSRPQGVQSVVNPVPATGGADREDRDRARRNAPLGVTALDRIVSVQDYADFARTFGGIGKASASRLPDGRRDLVHLTIAGEDDIPVDVTSPLYRSLREAVARFGDPHQPVLIEPRRLRLLVVGARIRLDPDRVWEEREPVIRQAVLDRFAFARRELGQDVARGEVIGVIQNVSGVDYVDLDVLDAIDEERVVQELTSPSAQGLGAELTLRHRIHAQLARIVREPQRRLIPAELVILRPTVPNTLVLTEIPA